MAFVNNRLVPLFAGFAWISISVVAGLSYAKRHSITGLTALVPIGVAAAVVVVAFVGLCALLAFILERKYSRQRNRGG
jgi:hypothetical protein